MNNSRNVGQLTRIASSRPIATWFDAWASRDWLNGVQIDSCPAFERLVVRTLNSVYEVIVLHGNVGEVLIRGGRFFPEFCRARLSGATFGGSALKLTGIHVGLRMELHTDGQVVVTSTVLEVAPSKDRCRPCDVT